MRRAESEESDEVPAWVLLVLTAVGQAVVLSLLVAIGTPGGAADAGAYLFACGLGAVLLARRHAPVAVLLTTLAAIFGYYILDYPPIGMAVPAVAALYFAAESGQLRWAIGAGLVLLGVSGFFRIAPENEPAQVLAYDLLTNAALVGCSIALAVTVRSRRQLREQQRRIVHLEREHARDQAEQRMQEERLRVARDLHDTVGHALTVVSVHANVAREAIGVDEDAAMRSLGNVTDATSRSLRELRSTVAMLRAPGAHEDDARAPLRLAGIEDILDSARQAGLEVTAELIAEPPRVPATVAATVHRIVQEAVTNVIRHADATGVIVLTRIEDDTLRLRVQDDGRRGTRFGGDGGEQPSGRGIAGMRERAALLGGTVTVRPQAEGLLVEATFPLAGPPPARPPLGRPS
ncbi:MULTISPECIES: sensor histidine kinase [Actinoalloteichus]|uniref:histidine kinase n=1 Tax=Actinoalloteichus fjordicus TaxID=1612552 RepID=A0AAC9LF57_9PSEU|nr:MULTISPECIES: sensor histidine kinase [Actinoalloteichus]APU16497.1 signal transduction histidine kinase [Actinoalloteichus fjordicus]APU22565.1 signal transduction histidine kinase [Actinoalloteichus sp. GBA129-24]